MTLDEIIALDKKYYMNTFGDRLPVAFESGKGIKLFSTDGKEYYDFLGGIAVNALGHSHPKHIANLKRQLEKVLHTSNLYYIENQARLAEKLCEHSCADKAFFASTGAEANEGAIKLAKIYFYKQGKDKFEVISLNKSFHGRTLATVAATGQKKYQMPYRPLIPGFKQVEPNNIEEMKAAITDKTAAIMIEPIQGESGVYPMDKEYIAELRKICDEKEIILIFDEVQTGMGRTGEYFAHQYYGTEPDIFTCAKALGGGIPIGGIGAKDFVAAAFAPGDHGTTFGGNPFAAAAGLSVFEIFEEENILDNVKQISMYFMDKLEDVKNKHNGSIVDLRNAGLLIGIELKENIARDIFMKLFNEGFLTSLCGNTIRLAPPLIITKQDVDEFIKALEKVL